jgi:hypothetical protein
MIIANIQYCRWLIEPVIDEFELISSLAASLMLSE